MKDTKPFCLEHAKAGAPYACANGREATILKWDARRAQPLLGFQGETDTPTSWHHDGGYVIHGVEEPHLFDLVMTPLGYINDKPVFVGDEIELKCMAKPNEWKRVKAEPTWAGTWTDDCARWPAPAKQYPVTGMSDEEMSREWTAADGGERFGDAMRRLANAALRHAVDVGQVIPLEQHVREIGEAVAQEFQEAIANRVARDMAIAKAVVKAVQDWAGNRPGQAWKTQGMASEVAGFDLAAIIAKVQA